MGIDRHDWGAPARDDMKRILPNRWMIVALLTPCGPMVFGIFDLFGMIAQNIKNTWICTIQMIMFP